MKLFLAAFVFIFPIRFALSQQNGSYHVKVNQGDQIRMGYPTSGPHAEEGALFNEILAKIITKCGDHYYYSGSSIDPYAGSGKRDVDYFKASFPPLRYPEISEADEANGITKIVRGGLASKTVAVKYPYEKWSRFVELTNDSAVWGSMFDVSRPDHLLEPPPLPILIEARKEKGKWTIAQEPITFASVAFKSPDGIHLLQPKLTCDNANLERDARQEVKLPTGYNPAGLEFNDSDDPSDTLQPSSVTALRMVNQHPIPGLKQRDPAATAIFKWGGNKLLTSYQVFLLKDDLKTTFLRGKVPLKGNQGAIKFIREACTYDIKNPPTSYNGCTQITSFLMSNAVVRTVLVQGGEPSDLPPTLPGTYYMLSIGAIQGTGVPVISYYVIDLKGSDGMAMPPAPNVRTWTPDGKPPDWQKSAMYYVAAENVFPVMKVR